MDGAVARNEKDDDEIADLPGALGDLGDLPGSEADGLTRREREILAFERQWWKYAGSKEAAVKELFDISSTRYYQLLGKLVDRPEALAADPMLIKRLRRLRAARQKARAARKLGFTIT